MTTLACTACIRLAWDGYSPLVEVPDDATADMLLKVTEMRVIPAPYPQPLPGSFGVRWVAHAAEQGLAVRWPDGSHSRPRGITAVGGELLCERHVRPF